MRKHKRKTQHKLQAPYVDTYSTSPIKVKVMLYFDPDVRVDFGHIGIKAWVPGTMHRYCIHFVQYLDSTVDWGHKVNWDNADNDEETCDRYFVFDSSRTLAELAKWHKSSKFYDKSRWNIYHNCADAIRTMTEEFFGIEVSQVKSCFKTPFSSCLWFGTRIALPRAVYSAIEKAVNKAEFKNVSSVKMNV